MRSFVRSPARWPGVPRRRAVILGGGVSFAPMKRRPFLLRTLPAAAAVSATAVWGVGAPFAAAHAQGVPVADALAGLRAALAGGAKVAVQQLGREGGFSGHPQLRIGLPGVLADAEPLLRGMGQGPRLDALLLAMNQAAERAVPLAANLLSQAIARLTVEDAWAILRGGDTAVTHYFAQHTRQPLTAQFLPAVRRSTEGVGLADKYQSAAGKAARLGLIQSQDADLPAHVTGRALDGLYAVIGEEERKLRQNPAAAGSAVLKKVFGAL